ncbi:DUF192 domain-containing protein [Piscinibacter sp.]|uniref:DUF192 domain-containing protein n=1 Tax=Piscinibacter sp. TaxID=1903157 RepID=UPI002ED67C2E
MVHHARRFWSRLAGLLARPELRKGEALYLQPCRGVHTFFLSYDIDVVFLDGEQRVIQVVADLKPWRTAMCPRAQAALELRGGQAHQYGIAAGQVLSEVLVPEAKS